MSGVSVEVKGIKETQKKMEQVVRDLRGTRVINAMRQATLLVQRRAKINATTYPKVQTGRLRASIMPEVISQGMGMTVKGVVGSNVEYAPYQELGTRYIKPRKYLQWALEYNIVKIKQLFEKTVARLVRE